MDISELIGKTMVSVQTDGTFEITFNCANGESYKLYHEQDCCEDVTIDDIAGDLADLEGSPILMAEVSVNPDELSPELSKRTTDAEEYGTCTWTFYRLATVKGYVDIRWFGVSNGYYSEAVDFVRVGTLKN